MIKTFLLVCLLFLPIMAIAQTPDYPLEEIASCKLGDDASQPVRILRGHEISDSYVYYVETPQGLKRINSHKENEEKKSGKWEADELEDFSRSSDTLISCVGTKEHLLVVTGPFPSNYMQTIVFGYDSKGKKIERIDSGSRSFPTQVYFNDQTIKIVHPYGMEGEKAEYTVFSYTREQGQLSSERVEFLPDPKGYEVISLKEPQ